MQDRSHSQQITFLQNSLAESKRYETQQEKAIASLEADKRAMASALEQVKIADQIAQQAAQTTRTILGQIGQVKAAISERVARDPDSDIRVRSDAIDWLRQQPATAPRGGVSPGAGGDPQDSGKSPPVR